MNTDSHTGVAPQAIGLMATNAATEPEYLAGSPEWREASAALHSRLRGSIADTIAELQRLYPKTWATYVPRPAAYVSWLTRQLADLYTDEPTIEYLDPETGDPLDADVVAEIGRARAKARITPAMGAAHEEMVACGNGSVWVEPVVRRNELGVDTLEPQAVSVPVHAQAVFQAVRPGSRDERDVTTWWQRRALPGSTTGLFGVARITADEAVWEMADGQLVDQSIWPRTSGDAPSNPLGQVPAVVLRWSEPDEGQFWSNARWDLLWQARAVDHGYTNQGETEITQGHGQWFGAGLTQDAGKIQFGRRVLIEGKDDKAKLENVQPRPDLAGGQNSLEGYLRVSVASHDANPATLIRNQAVTARGKEIELDDRRGLRRRHIQLLAEAEQRLYDLLRAWHVALGLRPLPAARLRVTYPEARLPQDPLHEAQSAKMWIDMRQESPVTLYAARKGVSLDDARKAVEAIDADVKAFSAMVKGPDQPGVVPA